MIRLYSSMPEMPFFIFIFLDLPSPITCNVIVFERLFYYSYFYFSLLFLVHNSFEASYTARSQLFIPSRSTTVSINLLFLCQFSFFLHYEYSGCLAPPSILGFIPPSSLYLICITNSFCFSVISLDQSGYISLYPIMTLNWFYGRFSNLFSSLCKSYPVEF